MRGREGVLMDRFDQFYGLPGTAERSENERGGFKSDEGKIDL